MRSFVYSSLLVFTLVGCGGDADSGTGSDTLLVDADVIAFPEISNAQDGIDFTTELRVRCLLNDTEVRTGTVIVFSDGGSVPLFWDGDINRWRGAQAGYYGVYSLDVDSGDDYVHGVTAEGPGIHVFTAPAAGATVDGTAPLVVTWDRGDAADSATIETRETDPIAIPDTGVYELPAGILRTQSDQATEDELRLRRSSRVIPSGAVGGSELRVSIENRIEIFTAPTGL